MDNFNHYLLDSHKTSDKEFIINAESPLRFNTLWTEIQKLDRSPVPGVSDPLYAVVSRCI